MAKGDRIVNGHSSENGCTHCNLLFLLLVIFILTNSSVTSIRITQFPVFFFFFREKGKMYFQSPRTNNSRHHCQTDLFPQVHFFYQRRWKGCKAHSPHRSRRHTGLFSHRFVCNMGTLYALLPHGSIVFSIRRYQGQNIACFIRYAALSSTQVIACSKVDKSNL